MDFLVISSRISLIAVALLTLVTAVGAESTPSQGEALTVDALGWLSGCWAREGKEAGTDETWTSPAGGTLLGTSRTVHDGKTVFHEFMMIRPAEDGGLEFVAWPSGQAEASFPMVEKGEHRVVFENPEHDFPQRIVYHLREDVQLDARIEGKQNGETQGVDFRFRRVACP